MPPEDLAPAAASQSSWTMQPVMDTDPLISFITPTFNREKLLVQTLESLRAQTDPRWENVVVDDGSSDGTVDLVRSCCRQDPRFRFMVRERAPKGACTCRNIGVEQARGKYVVFLDSDDLAAPHCAEQRAREMEAHPNLDFGVFQALLFESTPGDLGRWWNIDKPNVDELTRQFMQDVLCQGTGPAFNKASFIRVGMWDETLTLWQDVDLLFRLYIQGYRHKKFLHLPADVYLRESPQSLSRSDFFARHKLESRFRVVQKAVRLLIENAQSARVREARYMAAEVISAAARSHNDDLAATALRWAKDCKVLNQVEAADLQWFCTTARLRLTRFSFVARWLKRKMRWSDCSGSQTLGRIPSSESPVATED